MRPCPDHGDRFIIRCPSARRLKAAVADSSRRRPEVYDEIDAIRRGDNRVLLVLVRRVQHGDSEAANLVLWSLLPQACGYIRTRLPLERWRSAVDEFLGLLYLTVRDVALAEPAEALAVKLVQRAKRRYERANKPRVPEPVDADRLADATPPVNDVERRVLARLELERLGGAIADGVVSNRSWHALITARLGLADDYPSGADRMAALRADRKLTAWRNAAA
jgi:hypothetical protein